MPLNAHDRKKSVDQSLNDIIAGPADSDKILTQAVYGLMMGRIHLDTVPVELVKEIPPAKVTVEDIVKLVKSDPLVVFCCIDMLRNIAFKMNIDQLKSLADAEHGLFFCHKSG